MIKAILQMNCVKYYKILSKYGNISVDLKISFNSII